MESHTSKIIHCCGYMRIADNESEFGFGISDSDNPYVQMERPYDKWKGIDVIASISTHDGVKLVLVLDI